MFKHFVTGYFGFTKKERTGVLVLLSIILFFTCLPFFYDHFIQHKVYDPGAFEKEIAALRLKQADSTGSFVNRNYDENNYQNYYDPAVKNYTKSPKGELFYFDPNTVSGADWKRLGAREKTVITIQKYLSKGGKFYKPEDIRKIWGFHEDEVLRLLPWVQIKNTAFLNPQEERKYEARVYEKVKPLPAVIDINNADTAALVALPGIGSKLSLRIVNFRDKLGGFYKVDQVGETFGLPDSTFQKIRSQFAISNAIIKQINVNTATVDEMKTHPYLRYALANAIVQYRTQHGKYNTVADLKKIMVLTEEAYNKVSPYLKVD